MDFMRLFSDADYRAVTVVSEVVRELTIEDVMEGYRFGCWMMGVAYE